MKTTLFFALIGLVTSCTFILWEPERRTYTIVAGEHYPVQPVGTRYYQSPTTLVVTALFDSTCIYDIGEVDQADWNKLWGYGFLGVKHQGFEAAHRVDSFRFGWRWNPATQLIDVSAYVYDEGTRLPDCILASVAIGQPVTLSVNIDYGRGEYQTEGKVIPFHHRKHLAYACGPYFGGNVPAPHTVHFTIQN